MGIFKFFKRSSKSETEPNETPSNSNENSQQPKRRKSSFRRALSSESMRKIRDIGRCLRIIGDDVDRLSQQGSTQNVNVQGDENNQRGKIDM